MPRIATANEKNTCVRRAIKFSAMTSTPEPFYVDYTELSKALGKDVYNVLDEAIDNILKNTQYYNLDEFVIF